MPSFNPDKDIPDLTDKVIIVTGGNIGLGYETVLQFAKHKPAHIYLGARSAEKADAAITKIKAETSSTLGIENVPRITHLALDLSSFASIKSAAETFNAAEQKLDILVNNAGVMGLPAATTPDGYEIQLGTNHLGGALFTRLLLPTLQRTAEAEGADVRVINLASIAEGMTVKGGLALKDAKSDMKDFSTWTRYGQSKLANVLYTKALAKRYPKILFASVHPGAVKTNIFATANSGSGLVAVGSAIFTNLLAVPVQKGAWGQEWAATAPRKLVKSGAFYHPFMKEVKGSKNAQSKVLEEQLWDWTDAELSSKGF
ncbi:hypothetical protein FH972_025014 [Carpinus fangiana]|uniref:Uncharacterized protein n=1 Tax=Carpinus fangiana TaxID=176857 RepID=A0A5N6L2A5_9ROSI|nr:hypothetical protein FH972_025014 [Carpinus fangiana]